MKFNEYINLSSENTDFSQKLTSGENASFASGIVLFRAALMIAICKNANKKFDDKFKDSLKREKKGKNFSQIGAIDPDNLLRDILTDRTKNERLYPARFQDMGNWGLTLLRENYLSESGDYLDWEKIKKELLSD